MRYTYVVGHISSRWSLYPERAMATAATPRALACPPYDRELGPDPATFYGGGAVGYTDYPTYTV